ADELRAGRRVLPPVRALGPGGTGALAARGTGAGGRPAARAPDPPGRPGADRAGRRREAGEALRRHPHRARPRRTPRRPLADRHGHLPRAARGRPGLRRGRDDRAVPGRGGLGSPGARLAGAGPAARDADLSPAPPDDGAPRTERSRRRRDPELDAWFTSWDRVSRSEEHTSELQSRFEL